MAGKVEIATTTHSTEEVASILSEYTSARLLKRTQLFGGYSGSNYRVDLDDGSAFVLKITNGYSAEHAELMCQTANHLSEAGYYKDCCLPIPRRQQHNDNQEQDQRKFRFVSKKEKKGVPAFLLTFVEGRQADAVMRERPDLASAVMRGIGGGLARMHIAASGITQEEARRLKIRWYQTDGGCCDVQDQIDGKVLSSILNCIDEKKRDVFLNTFYNTELAALRKEMKLAVTVKEGINKYDDKEETEKNISLEHGICHGDPFADNVLVFSDTGKLSALVDIEDFCAGPVLFDLCCCAIGCCFKQQSDCDDGSTKYPQVLDMNLLKALLKGYCADRKIPQIERDHFIPFMRLTLLCNCSWRFVKFNVSNNSDDKDTDDFPEEAKNSYLELQHRIEYLRDPEVVQQIKSLLLAQEDSTTN
eukprot:CAMPEP_0194362194 /NCGR_PEP_ID=MMETSP0174-20130528/9902_1 /TAXON_ID=216777 /ORGANISM="Proboscia alata, Strain PI-D3" /LENGTH=416 /DNA_ID=CAMNT_0039134897 /DNA_START=44 /DNA_END=1294 /DNA_ORIENTATION=+